MSVHDLDLAGFLVGEVEEVCAWAGVLIDERLARAGDADTAVTLLKFKNGVLGVAETSRRSKWGYDIRTEVAGAKGKVVVEAPQKTPIVFANDFRSSFDHYENFPDRFEAAYRLELEAFLTPCERIGLRVLVPTTHSRRSDWPSRSPRVGVNKDR